MPNRRIERLRDRARLELTTQRVGHDRVRELVEQLARRDVREDRDDRQHEEAERDGAAASEESRTAEQPRRTVISASPERQEAERQHLRLAGLAEHLVDERLRAGLVGLAVTTAIA